MCILCQIYHMDTNTRHWLAGLMEGEGSFLKGPPSKSNSCAMAIEMVDEEVISRVAKIWNKKYSPRRRHNPKWNSTFRCMMRGNPAKVAMLELRPLMSVKRKMQIDEAVASCTAIAIRKLDRRLLENLIQRADGGESLRSLAKETGVNWKSITKYRRRFEEEASTMS